MRRPFSTLQRGLWPRSKISSTTTVISFRVADRLLDGFRQEANKVDVPHQSLMKVWLTETLREVNG